MAFATVSGMNLRYEDRGSGAPLLLLHGFLSDHRDWRPQLEELSPEFRVVALDLPGCGQSPDPPESWRFPEYADCVAAFLAALGIDSAHVAGLSWGGTLAQELYKRHPQCVRSLILADTYAGWGPSLGWDVARERLELCLGLSELDPHEVVDAMIGGMFTSAPSEELAGELREIMSEFHPSGFRTMSRAVAEVDTTGVWGEISVPTLLLWGKSDARSPVSVAEHFHRGVPGAELVLIPGGHVSNMESPEAFNEAVRAFLTRVEYEPAPRVRNPPPVA